MDVHCGGFQGNDDGSDVDARRNGDPAYEQEFPRGFLHGCTVERTGPDRGRESFLRSHGHAEANRLDAGPSAKGGVTTSDPGWRRLDAIDLAKPGDRCYIRRDAFGDSTSGATLAAG